jgi:hypothetical protein
MSDRAQLNRIEKKLDVVADLIISQQSSIWAQESLKVETTQSNLDEFNGSVKDFIKQAARYKAI